MQQPTVGPGLCECGCGTATKLARWNNPSRGNVKGQPVRFAHGHSAHNGPVAFWRKVPSHLPADQCWPWQGNLAVRFGYGSFGCLIVHREVFETFNGPIPAGLHVCHHCDNPPCCNPAHLFLGTHADNMADRGRKGRSKSPTQRLTAVDVQAIRAKFAAGDSIRSLALDYEMGYSTVSGIVSRRSWTHM